MKYNMMQILLMSLFNIFILNSCSQQAEPENYILPANFKGKVNIIFNQKHGEAIKYEDNRRIYEIPESGILLTQFTTNDGFTNRKYYYKKATGELQQLKLMEKDTVNKTDEIGIFLDGISGVYGNSGEPSALQYQEFIVASKNNIDSFFTKEYTKEFYKKIEKISGLKF